MIVSGQNNSCWGTNVSGHNHVWAQIKCVWAQTCLGTNQMCLGTNVCGHKSNVSGQNHVWAQIKCVWAQTCVGTVMWAQSCGPNHVWAQTWWNHSPQPIHSISGLNFLNKQNICNKLEII